jgi:hypothetical protein
VRSSWSCQLEVKSVRRYRNVSVIALNRTAQSPNMSTHIKVLDGAIPDAFLTGVPKSSNKPSKRVNQQAKGPSSSLVEGMLSQLTEISA